MPFFKPHTAPVPKCRAAELGAAGFFFSRASFGSTAKTWHPSLTAFLAHFGTTRPQPPPLLPLLPLLPHPHWILTGRKAAAWLQCIQHCHCYHHRPTKANLVCASAQHSTAPPILASSSSSSHPGALWLPRFIPLAVGPTERVGVPNCAEPCPNLSVPPFIACHSCMPPPSSPVFELRIFAPSESCTSSNQRSKTSSSHSTPAAAYA